MRNQGSRRRPSAELPETAEPIRRERGVELVEWGAILLLVAVVVGVVAAGVPGVVKAGLEPAICRVFDPQCTAGPDKQAGTAAPAPQPSSGGGGDACGLLSDVLVHEIEGGDGGEVAPPRCTGGDVVSTPADHSPPVAAAIDRALLALKQPDCNKLITGTKSRFTAEAILFTLKHNNHIVDNTSKNSPNQEPGKPSYAVTDIGRGSNGYMTIWKPFAQPEAGSALPLLSTYQGETLNKAENWEDIFRAAIILHEVSHATGALGSDRGWSPQAYARNLDLILATCL